MPHRLQATFTLSGPLSGGTVKLGEILPQIAAEALSRSVRERGHAELARWKLDGLELEIELHSSEVRPHQALLAIQRRLQEALGKAEKVGIRAVRVPSYVLEFPVERLPEKSVELPIPHHLEFENGMARLELRDLTEQAIRDNWPDRAVSLVEEKIRRQSYEGKEQYWKLLWQSPRREMPTRVDPTEAMLARTWIRSGPTKGKWFLGPRAAHLLKTMERIAREKVLGPLGFSEVVQPHHDSFEILLRTGHLEGVPGEFYYVAEPRTRDPVAWGRFTDLVKITRKVPEPELAALVGPPSAVACYAQCPTIYWWLSGRTLGEESLPLKVYDRTAISNRYESGGRHGLERVDEFHRIEPVYVGTRAQLLDLREKLRECYAHVFNDILELEWRMAWVTPFYLQQSGELATDDSTEQVQGTIDFEAYLPYRGSREESEWLEFQNLSIVGDKYTRAFTIKAQRGELWSGCTGIGLERWLTAFLAQKGLEESGWPASFREFALPLPSEPRFL